MRRKQVLMLSTAAAGAIIGLGGVAHAQVVTLSIKTSGTSWSVYANDSNSQTAQVANAGIADFDIDVIGSGGETVTSSKVATPLPNSDADYGDTDGFDTVLSNGNAGVGITAAQFPAYSGAENPESDEVVIQGFGQVSSTATITDYWNGGSGSATPGAPYTTTGGALWGPTWTQTTQGVLIADGKDSGTGVLTAQADPTALAGFQTLDIVSNGVWFGPGNTGNAATIPGVSGSVVSTAPAFQLFGTAAVGSSLGPEAVETGHEPYNLFTDTESPPVDSGYLQFTGFAAGDTVDLLLKFGLTNGSGDPATGQTLSDIINYINSNDGTEGTIASAVPAGLAAEYPGYDLLISAPAPVGDPFADLDFAGFSSDGIAGGTLGVAGLALVPEPASVSLLVLGGLGLMSRRRNRKNEA